MEIGIKIKELRIKKNITQEEVAKALKISTQAVSKWENGGSPDLELVPAIAKYFHVSIDYLFGLPVNDYENIEEKIVKYLEMLFEQGEEVVINKIFELAFYMETALFNVDNIKNYTLDKIIKSGGCNSQYISEHGLIITSLKKNKKFFGCFPLPKEGSYNELLKNKVLYLEFFKDLSDETFFDALVFLYTRKNLSFTTELFINELNIDIDTANKIISRLLKYQLLSKNVLELNDQNMDTYRLRVNPAIIGLLAFTDLMVKRPNAFYFSMDNTKGEFFKK